MNHKPTRMWPGALLSLLLLPFNLSAEPAVAHQGQLRWQLEELLESGVYPFAIGHRGYGENDGTDPTRPIENTRESVARAYSEGAQAVEVDVVLTADNQVVALHDDYLDDLSCVNQLSFDELRLRQPSVSKLRWILNLARHHSKKRHSERPSGLLIVEIKTPSPLCDAEDSEQIPLADAVVNAVRHSRMSGQVLIESFSPEILDRVALTAPELPRMLTVSAYQLLTPEQITAYTGLSVNLLDKPSAYGLQWVEAGEFFRAPLYASAGDYLFTLAASGSRAASIDKTVVELLESQAPGSTALLIAQLHQIGQRVTVYTVNDQSEWMLLAALGVDGIYTDDLPMGLALEGIGSVTP